MKIGMFVRWSNLGLIGWRSPEYGTIELWVALLRLNISDKPHMMAVMPVSCGANTLNGEAQKALLMRHFKDFAMMPSLDEIDSQSM